MRIDERTYTYTKWQKKIMRGNLFFLFLTLFVEIFVFIMLKSVNLTQLPDLQHIARFIILPTFCQLFCITIGAFLIDRARQGSQLVNYIPVVQMAVMCFIVAAFYSGFTVTLGIFCIPVFITVLFNNRGMTRNITLFCILLLLLTLIIQYHKLAVPDNRLYLITEGMQAVAIIVFSGTGCRTLLEFQQEKERIIKKAHKSHNLMQERLNRDPKTGLYTAKAFFTILRDLIEENEKKAVILAVVDIDDFKKVNDTYGHASGDIVIERLAGLLLKTASDKVIPARFGGEEFAVIFTTDLAAAYRWIEYFRLQFASQKYKFMPGRVTVSCGLAAYKSEWTEDQLFENADQAMYHSKQSGKNLVTIFSNRMAGNQ